MSSTTNVLHPNLPTSLSVHWCYLLKLTSITVGAKGWFSITIILSTLIAWHSIVKNSFLFSLIYSFRLFIWIWTPDFFDSIIVYYHHYLFWCSSSLSSGQWKFLQDDPWVLLTYIHDSLSISKSLTQDTLGSYCNFFYSSFGISHFCKGFRNQGLSKRCAHCYWVVLAFNLLKRESKEIYICVCVGMWLCIHTQTYTHMHYIHVYTHLYLFLPMSYILKKIQFHVEMSNSIVEPQGSFQSFLLPHLNLPLLSDSESWLLHMVVY